MGKISSNTYLKVLLVLAVILNIGVGWWLFRQYGEIRARALETEKTRIAELVQNNAAQLVQPADFSTKDIERQKTTFERFFAEIQSPSLIRLKIWNRDFTIIWSSLLESIGQRFPDNEELKGALEGEVELEIEKEKAEHVTERQYVNLFEIYVPYRDASGSVVGVIEIYEPAAEINQKVKREFQNLAVPTITGTVIVFAIAALILFFLISRRKVATTGA